MKDALVPVLVVIGLLLLAGLTLFLVRRPRRGALPPTEQPRPGIERGEQVPPSVITAPAPEKAPERVTPTKPAVPAPAPPAAGETAPPVEAPPAPAAPEIEQPEPTAGRLVRLRARLSRSQNVFGKGLLGLLSRDHLDDDAWDEVEESLISADVGVQATTEIVAKLRERTRVLGTRTSSDLRTLLTEELTEALDPKLDRSLHTGVVDGRPSVILVVGVNGAGKTTSCGKIARVLVADGHTVVLGAADTFRAAAAEQLATWGSRVGAQVVRGPEGGDPAAVAFDAVKKGIEAGVDTVLIDTAGRLQNKVGLMDELGKIKRVVEKHGPVSETLLVLDATAGQNGLSQARVFTEVADVTGVVLTKLDGTAKGGIVIAVQRALGIPVKLVGLGEGPDDLAPFDPQQFVAALLGDE
ncbi:signal recognition particle receptor FtsY [Catellatospora methionotrophica]|uniref:Signal recognition particle receptor FtsY n=1 Tax=Catellatospora methionotrophica TaxID=121620 RepID=A0A8J3LLP0_9ACTN|nr:signal recognition particle-docking protein FtsY [Catellatospora methionotrophica]GIG17859.1 signal recognition particle receptor FtsY [Catellatospora methionotrophica]